MMKNELINVWYCVTFMVTVNNERCEHSVFIQDSSEIGAAVAAAVGICESRGEKTRPSFKTIRIATYGEADSLDAELDAIAEREAKELEEEDDE